jgi:preprotein translocase subunit SecF
VIVGTYSSIFLAAPIFMYISRRWYSSAPSRRRVAQPAVSASSGSAESAEP